MLDDDAALFAKLLQQVVAFFGHLALGPFVLGSWVILGLWALGSLDVMINKWFKRILGWYAQLCTVCKTSSPSGSFQLIWHSLEC